MRGILYNFFFVRLLCILVGLAGFVKRGVLILVDEIPGYTIEITTMIIII